MRKLFLLFAVAVAVASCIGDEELQFSPQIYSSHFYVNPVFDGDSVVWAKDTLNLFYDAEDNSYEMDTIYLGDTVVFAATFYSFTSNLVAVELKWEKDFMELWYPLTESITNVLTDQSDLNAGKLYFETGYNRVTFPIYFTPMVRGGMTLKMTVQSDSEYSTSSVLLYIPAIEEPAKKEE